MADLRIADAEELQVSAVEDGLKIPTGGFGNYSITMLTITDWLLNYKNFATKEYVDGSSATVNQSLINHVANTNNPHNVTKAQVGLGNVNNTADLDKPISDATAAALTLKADKANTYTKTEVDNKDNLKANITYVDTQLGLKADKTTTYTKTEVDTALNTKVNKSVYDVFYNHEKSGLTYQFDSQYVATYGGYPLGAELVLSDGLTKVVSTVANNTNDPNVNMTGWVNISKKIKNIDSILGLQEIDINLYKEAFAKAYYENGDKRGGGVFYYDGNDTTSAVDNIFVFASSSAGRWKRKIEGTSINTAQAGIVNDGSDQGEKLQALFNAAVNASMQYGYTWRITIDGLEQRVWSSIPLTCNITLLRLKDIWINSTIPDQSSISSEGVAITFVGSDSFAVDKPDTWRRKSRSKAIDNVNIFGSNKTNTVGVLFKPSSEGNFANYVFEGLVVESFKYNIVFSSDCFLMTFNDCAFAGASERIITYSSNIGLSSTLVNMGENIRFNSCTFANSRNIADLNYESWITFDKCSFDYCGKSTDVEGWFKTTAGVGLNFIACHFEAGNSNAQLGKYLFYTTDVRASVNIFGGTFVFGGNLNDNDYIFYSTSPLNGNFQVDGLWCFGQNVAKKGWSNTKMGRFKISSNSGVGLENVSASGLQAINKSVTKDAKFLKSVLMNTPYDFWFVNGLDSTSTNQLANPNIASSFGLNSDSSGTSYNSLKVRPAAGDQTLYCLIKRKDVPKSNMSPVIRLSHFASREVRLFIRMIPADVKFTRNAQGVEIPTFDTSRWTDDTLGFFVNNVVNTAKSETNVYTPSTQAYSNIDSFDYFLVQINFSTNSDFDYIVAGLECYEVDV